MQSKTTFSGMLAGLEAAGEVTRLRLLALLADAELTVSELTTILGQSQPRISRHLRLLVEAGLIDRHREGAWAFFRVAEKGTGSDLVHDLIGRIDPADPVLADDRSRLAEVRRARADQAARYFADHAAHWDHLRSLHVAEDVVEAAILAAVGQGPFHAVLDLGTGTGRMLELLAPLADRTVGIDQSPAMLNLARTRIEREGPKQVQLRQGDLYALPVERDGYDVVILHQVLHYLDDPVRALREAARVLRPGGRLIVIDFAPHHHEFLRDQHAHRRLGFGPDEIASYLRDAGLEVRAHRDLPADSKMADALTVSLWLGQDPRLLSDLVSTTREVA